MADVFISYKSEDKERAEQVAKGLQKSGLSVWWDSNIEIGSDFQGIIEKELRAAQVVVVLWTAQSVKSLWVRSEATVAEKHNILVPVRLEPCDIPIPFQLIQTADLTKWQGDLNNSQWHRFTKDVQQKIARAREQRSAPPLDSERSARDLEDQFWRQIHGSSDIDDLETYLTKYPDGYFADEARRRHKLLRVRRKYLITTGMTLGAGLAAFGAIELLNQHAPSTTPPVAPPAVTVQNSMVPVPNIVGMPVEIAAKRLQEVGLTLGQKTFLTLNLHAPGIIYNQDPQANARVVSGTAIDLMVVRERAPGIQYSGFIHLKPTEVFDLDGTGGDRTSHDIYYPSDAPDRRRLEADNGATLAIVGRDAAVQKDCENSEITASEAPTMVGSKICVRTTDGRLSLVTIVDVAKELTIEFSTWEQSSGSTGVQSSGDSVMLGDGDSRHFKGGTTSKYTGGDFYLGLGRGGAAMFYANNKDQRGLIDIGDVGTLPLPEIRIPGAGYYMFGVPAVERHSYVSLAKRGEEGHFIVFRVEKVTEQGVTLRFLYR